MRRIKKIQVGPGKKKRHCLCSIFLHVNTTLLINRLVYIINAEQIKQRLPNLVVKCTVLLQDVLAKQCHVVYPSRENVYSNT